jgi:hypothetical protein
MMATVTILFHKAKNPLTANGHHIIATVTTIHKIINIITPKSLNSSK